MSGLIEYQDEKVFLSSGPGSENVVVGEESLILRNGSGKEGHGMGQHLLAGSGLRKWKRNKQETEEWYILAAECAIRLSMLMRENLSTQSYYHTFS